MTKNILSLEKTIEELNEEIVRVTDKIQEKNKQNKLEATTATTTTQSSQTTTTTAKQKTSTYFPSQKKIRIKLPLKKNVKESKPRIQPYEYPIIQENLTERTSFYYDGGVESTTIIYAIPYRPEEESTTVKSF